MFVLKCNFHFCSVRCNIFYGKKREFYMSGETETKHMTPLYLALSIMYPDPDILHRCTEYILILAKKCSLNIHVVWGFEVVKYNLFFCHGSLAYIQFIFLHAGSLGQLHIDNSHACCGTILAVPSTTSCRVAHTVR